MIASVAGVEPAWSSAARASRLMRGRVAIVIEDIFASKLRNFVMCVISDLYLQRNTNIKEAVED